MQDKKRCRIQDKRKKQMRDAGAEAPIFNVQWNKKKKSMGRVPFLAKRDK